MGALVAGGAFLGYVFSRTTGLPDFYEAAFFESLGIASLVVEGLFVVVSVRLLARSHLISVEVRRE